MVGELRYAAFVHVLSLCGFVLYVCSLNVSALWHTKSLPVLCKLGFSNAFVCVFGCFIYAP